MNVTIQTATGSKSKLSVPNDCTVCQLKGQIEKILAFAPNDQNLLFYKDSLKEDNKRLSEYGIGDGSVIHFQFYPSQFNVALHLTDNRLLKVEVDRQYTVGRLKSKIAEVHSIPIDEYTILFKGNQIDNDSKLFDLGITDYCVLHAVPRARPGVRQILVRTLDEKTSALYICQNDKIRDIKMKMQEKIGLAPDEQKLVFQGGILDDDKTADEYQIAERSVINVVARLRNGIKIFAKAEDGMTVAVEIYKTAKIRDIKKKVQEKLGFAPHEQKLVFQGGILDDDKIVDEYQIVERSVIIVIPKLRGGMQIFAKTMDGKTVAFEVSKPEKISDIKKKVQERIRVASDEQELVFDTDILEDDKTVNEYQIVERSVINVVANLRCCIEIFAKTKDGKTISFEICKNDKIGNIKKKVQERIGLAPDEQKLVFRGRVLENDKTADECQIAEKSVINVITQPRCCIRIFAKTNDGTTIVFEICKNDRIGNIKKKLQEKIGLAPDAQRLVLGRVGLVDDKTAIECQISEGSVINVIKR